jgi:uncharacterized membrane protein
MKTNRLNAIVDGVFAIAMTLLVLDLPRPTNLGQVTHDLEIHWDAYIAYLVSFATLGVFWLEHRGMMLAVRRTSRTLIEITFVFLLFVALLPWPTALTAEYADEASASGLVTFIYSATMFLIAAALAGVWAYVSHHPELLVDDLASSFRQSFRRTCLVCVPYLVALPTALVSPVASLLIDATVVVFLASTQSPLERAEAGRTAVVSPD